MGVNMQTFFQRDNLQFSKQGRRTEKGTRLHSIKGLAAGYGRKSLPPIISVRPSRQVWLCVCVCGQTGSNTQLNPGGRTKFSTIDTSRNLGDDNPLASMSFGRTCTAKSLIKLRNSNRVRKLGRILNH